MLAADLQSAAWPPDCKSGGSKKVGKTFEELLSRFSGGFVNGLSGLNGNNPDREASVPREAVDE